MTNERMKYHNGRDRNSYLFKHSVKTGDDPVLKNDFRIIERGHRNNTRRRKKGEAFLLKKIKPVKIQEKSVKLNLFN